MVDRSVLHNNNNNNNECIHTGNEWRRGEGTSCPTSPLLPSPFSSFLSFFPPSLFPSVLSCLLFLYKEGNLSQRKRRRLFTRLFLCNLIYSLFPPLHSFLTSFPSTIHAQTPFWYFKTKKKKKEGGRVKSETSTKEKEKDRWGKRKRKTVRKE